MLEKILWRIFCRPFLVSGFAFHLHGKRMMWLIVCLLGTIILGVSGIRNSFSINSFHEIEKLVPALAAYSGALLALFQVWRQGKIVFSQACTKELKTYLRLPDYQKHLGSIPVMQKEIGTLCRLRLGNDKKTVHKKERRFLFVVDDLDRCSPEGILKTFEAVRLVMDIPRVTVLIAVDQGIALAALAHQYREIAEFSESKSPLCIARDYLAKMIHLPVTLSEPDEYSIRGFLSCLWKEENEKTQAAESDWYLDFLYLGEEQADNLPETNGALENKGKISADSETDKKALSEEELVQKILQIPRETGVPQEEFGLGDRQKASFYWWTQVYSLRNPRQIKRLLNSYNLLRLILAEVSGKSELKDDVETGTQKIDIQKSDSERELKPVPVFPLLLALVILEYLNDEEDAEKRREKRKALVNGSSDSPNADWKYGESGHLAEGAVRLGLAPESAKTEEAVNTLLDFVEPYVLPALEGKSET